MRNTEISLRIHNTESFLILPNLFPDLKTLLAGKVVRGEQFTQLVLGNDMMVVAMAIVVMAIVVMAMAMVMMMVVVIPRRIVRMVMTMTMVMMMVVVIPRRRKVKTIGKFIILPLIWKTQS